MGPRFNDPKLLANGDLEVTGPFSTDGDVIGDVHVRFLVIGDTQAQGPPPTIEGLVTLPGTSLTREPLPRGDVMSSGSFSAVVPNSAGFSVGDDVRLIGVAVAVKPSASDPPAFETLTWCVNRKVTS